MGPGVDIGGLGKEGIDKDGAIRTAMETAATQEKTSKKR